jgi:ribosome-associated protein
MKGKEIALIGMKAALEKKAADVIVMDMRKVSCFTDYFLICSGDTNVQIRAIADSITRELKGKKVKVWHMEGYAEAKWVLLDYGDVVVHIFDPEIRQFYRLERLWADAQVVERGGNGR